MGISGLVSVVVPNYNTGPALRLCLEALLAQTYENMEILLADDCSTDDSVETARALGVTVVSTGVNSGAATARNTGAEHARGEFIMFIDADVAMRPDAVARAVELMRENGRIGALCGTYGPEPLIPDGPVETYRCLHQHYWFTEQEGRIGTVHTAILMIRADVFREVGPFNTALRHTEDGDYADRLTARYESHSSNAVRGAHDHDDSLRTIFRKVFHRTRLHVPLYLRQGSLPGGFATGPRAGAALAALGAVLCVPLIVLSPLWAVVALGLLVGSILADRGLYAFVLDRKGLGFTLFFAGVHHLVNCAIALAGGIGLLQWIVSPRFRRLYDRSGTAVRP
ncbi:glycosyltransferase family 2 protein [Myceligenerans salitolerans]|uniref:Glycosyltransferase family 2 protein n=1 Tax=Myceligenerans salitolerans TaxID=1230528 RepID=A0ABS3IBZ6_9MICO|nr:glycosyltransferase family 2 protein [Myceligenerans salitolerans]MBO0610485.1 glycosyltransferase family 2 protein [Myceligenerans salitolerans]